jgi:hypothetical protein
MHTDDVRRGGWQRKVCRREGGAESGLRREACHCTDAMIAKSKVAFSTAPQFPGEASNDSCASRGGIYL